MQKHIKKRKCITAGNEKGVALILALVLLVIISGIGIFGINTSIVEGWRSTNYYYTKSALYAAEAGIEDGISRLVSGTVSDSGSETSTSWNSGSSYYSTNFNGSNGPNNSFTIQHRVVGSPSTVATSSGLTHYLITSTGTSHPSGTSGVASRTIEAVITLTKTSNSPFKDAMTGCDGVTLDSNATTSSYSSSGQPSTYDKGSIGTTNAGANIVFNSNADIYGTVSANGNITSSGNAQLQRDVKANGNITLSGNVDFMYNAYAGGSISMTNNTSIVGNATASGSITTANNASISGTRSPNTSPPTPYVPVQTCDSLNVANLFSTALTSISSSNNNGDLNTSYFTTGTRAYSIGGNSSSTLGTAGQTKNYYLSSFSMDSNSVLTVNGNVTMYVSGNFTLSSNSRLTLATGATLTIYDTGTLTFNSNTTINNNGAPKNLTIYSNATSSSHSDYKVNLNSNNTLNGVVYAPNAAVNISSNSSLYGSVRGDYINMNSNGHFYYDEDLASANFGGPQTITGYSLLSWRQKFN